LVSDRPRLVSAIPAWPPSFLTVAQYDCIMVISFVEVIGGASRERCSLIWFEFSTIVRQSSFFSASLSCDGRLRGACSDCSGVHVNATHLMNAPKSQNVDQIQMKDRHSIPGGP
jgi:hypothetical protein